MRRARFWVVTAAAVLAAACTLALGAWQWGRAQKKIALERLVLERKELPALDYRAWAATKNIADVLHRPVRLRGTWVAAHTVFLDNRQMNGKPGFYVVTPLQVEGAGAAVLVQRGWVQRNFIERQALPPVQTPAGVVEVTGRIAPAPAKLYQLGAPGAGPIRQNLDLDAFRGETRLALLDGSVQETGPAAQGLLRDWPQAASGVPKHYGYAFQWWALGGLIIILYAWFQFIAPRRAARRA